MSVLAINFDRNIMDTDNPQPGYKMGPPLPGVKEYLEDLYRQGHTIIVFTARGSVQKRKHVEDWLDYFKIPYQEVTNEKKQEFDYIVDYRAVPDFDTLREVLSGTD